MARVRVTWSVTRVRVTWSMARVRVRVTLYSGLRIASISWSSTAYPSRNLHV